MSHNSNKISTEGQYKVDYPTRRQEEILHCIRLAVTDQGDAPTAAEIAAAVGLRPSSVHYQLRELETKGAIIQNLASRAGSGSHDTKRYHLTLVALRPADAARLAGEQHAHRGPPRRELHRVWGSSANDEPRIGQPFTG
ncbi:hypothetical protein [Streptomyces althioticus]|uniref:LexA family protein n=1 Tax=Streptomyces althioticus TaxID=83380 RepID=UPI00331AAC9B